MIRKLPGPCRDYHETLGDRLEARASGEAPGPGDHAAACAECRRLLEDLSESLVLFRSLRAPEPSEGLVIRLQAMPSGATASRAAIVPMTGFSGARGSADAPGGEDAEAVSTLEFLKPGALKAPEPSAALVDALARIPTTRRRGNVVPFRPLPAWLADWRVSVAAAYVAAMLVVAVLGGNPYEVARGAMTELKSAGTQVVAQGVALKDDPGLTSRLRYRLYRAFEAGKARAVCYSQVVFEKLFCTPERPAQPAGRPSEPAPASRRS